MDKNIIQILNNDENRLSLHILKHWDRDKIVRFATHLMGDKCQRCSIKEGKEVRCLGGNMREIKFRLRIGNEIVGYEQWYIGDGSNSHWEYLKINDIVWRPTYIYHTKKDQFIGLLDKNGKEIYEGDIVKWQPHTIEEMNELFYDEPESQRDEIVPSFGYVIWKEAGFVIETINEGYEKFKEGDIFELNFYGYEGKEFSWHNLEVIGNIYENPELLKGGE